MSQSPPSKLATYLEELGQETINALLLAYKIPHSFKSTIFDDTASFSSQKHLIDSRTALLDKIEEMIARKRILKKHGFSINHQAIDFSCEAIVNAGNRKINADNFSGVGGISRAIHDYFTIDRSEDKRKSPLASLLEIEAKKNLKAYRQDGGGGIYLEDGKAMILSLDKRSAELDSDQIQLLDQKKSTVDFKECKYLIHAVGPIYTLGDYKINIGDDILTQKNKKTKRKKAPIRIH